MYMGDLIKSVNVYIWVVAFICVLVLFVVYYLSVKKCMGVKDALYETIIDDKVVLVVDDHDRLVHYSYNFKRLFPEVVKFGNYDDFADHYDFLVDIRNVQDEVVEILDVRYLLRIIDKGEFLYLVFDLIDDILKQGPSKIRSLIGDSDLNPVVFEIDFSGEILSAGQRLVRYYSLLFGGVIENFVDLGFENDVVKRFIEEVQMNKYVDGSLKVSALGVDFFYIAAAVAGHNSILIHLTLVGESQIESMAMSSTTEMMFNQIQDGLVTVDNFGKIIYANEKFMSMVHLDTVGQLFIQDIIYLYDQHHNQFTLEFPLEPKVHSYMWMEPVDNESRLVVEMVINEIREEDGFRIGYLLNFRDSSIRQVKEEADFLFAYMDVQTGTYNRHYLNDLISYIERENISNVGLVLVDLNGLKVINDAFGHEYGDIAVSHTASVLMEHINEGDRVIRVGGDEFLVVKYDVNKADLDAYIEAVKAAIDTIKVRKVPLSISCGVELHESGKFIFSTAMANAEMEMYHNKTVTSAHARKVIMESILDALVARHAWEGVHAQVVSKLNGAIARELEFSEETIEMVIEAGLYHNIGKVVLEEDVHFGGSDSKEHRDAFNKHNETAFRILSAMPEYSYLANAVLHYKENYDGSGQPKGLKGEAIPLSSRILRVSSSYHKLVNPGWANYEPCSKDQAIEILEREAGTILDPEIVAVLKKVVKS